MQNSTSHFFYGKFHKHLGFTLLEMSIVLVIIALIIAGSLATLTASVKTSQYNATLATMQAIDKALLDFKTANGRLPCPSDLTLAPSSTSYGLEAGATTGGVGTKECKTGMTPAANNETTNANSWPLVAEGAVPVNALKLPDSYMYDAWGNHIRYAVYVPLTVINAFTTSPINGVCSAITVEDYSGTNPRTTNAAYALISHGANGQGAYTQNGTYAPNTSTNANELINCHANVSKACNLGTYAATYVEALPAESTAGSAVKAFDDIVTYKQRWQLTTSSDPLPPYIYVVDPLYNRVNVYTSTGSYMTSIGGGYNGVQGTQNTSGNGFDQGAAPYGFNAPYGVAVDGVGNVWVTDTGNKKIEEFCADGTYLKSIGPISTPAATFGTASPTGIAIDKYNNIWVTDNGNNKLQECTTAGTCTSYGTGTYNGNSLSAPKGIAVDSSSNCANSSYCVWVADTGNSRVTILSGCYVSSGVVTCSGAEAKNVTAAVAGCASPPCSTFGTTGTGAAGVGQMNAPTGIAIDSRNYVWVADTGNNRVDEFTNLGGLPYTVVGGPTLPFAGGATNYFNLPTTLNTGIPQSLTFDAGGNIWLTDSGNAALEQFGPIGTILNSFPVNLLVPTGVVKTSNTAVSSVSSTGATLVAKQIINDSTGAYTYIPANTTISAVSSQTSISMSASATSGGGGTTIPLLIANPPQGIAVFNR